MRLVLVTGMHRSGTSLLANVVNLLGVDFGSAGDFLAPAPDNQRGFWESRKVVGLNNRVLDALGGDWTNPPFFPAGWETAASLDPCRKDAVQLLSSMSEGRPTVGWKDPRAALLFPFWRTIVDDMCPVVAVRHPAEVAASLRVRNGISLDRAADLWTAYTVRALLDAVDPLIVHYEGLLSHPEQVCEQLSERVGLVDPTAEVLAEVRRSVDMNLRHHDNIDSGDWPPSLVNAVSLHSELLARPLAEVLPTVRRHSEAIRLKQLETELAVRMTELSETHADVDSLAADHDALLAKSASADAKILHLEAQAGAVQLAFAERAELIARAQLAEARLRRIDREEGGEAGRAARRRLERELDSTRVELDRLRSRRVVRLGLACTAPLGKILRLARSSRGAALG